MPSAVDVDSGVGAPTSATALAGGHAACCVSPDASSDGVFPSSRVNACTASATVLAGGGAGADPASGAAPNGYTRSGVKLGSGTLLSPMAHTASG